MAKRTLSAKAIQREVLTEKKAQEIINKTLSIYQQAYKNIKRELEEIYTELEIDSGLNIAKLKQRLYGLEAKKHIQKLKDILLKQGIDINKQYSPDFLRKLSRLQILKERIYWEIKSINKGLKNIQSRGYRQIVQNTYTTSIQDLDDSMGISALVSPTTLNKDTVQAITRTKWLGSNYSSRMDYNMDKFATRTSEIIGAGILTGSSLPKIERQIRKEFNMSRYETSRLVRTESAFFHSYADLQSYIDYGIENYQFLATLDKRTSKICREHDAKIFRVSEAVIGFNFPPLHCNCRSTTCAYFTDNDIIQSPKEGKRFARDYVTGKKYETTARDYRSYIAEQRAKYGMKPLVAQDKMLVNISSDKKQFARYKQAKLFGLPRNFQEFQKLKYEDSGWYETMKSMYKSVSKPDTDTQPTNLRLKTLEEFWIERDAKKIRNSEGLKTHVERTTLLKSVGINYHKTGLENMDSSLLDKSVTFVYDRLKESNKLRQFVKEQKFFTFQKMFDKHDDTGVFAGYYHNGDNMTEKRLALSSMFKDKDKYLSNFKESLKDKFFMPCAKEYYDVYPIAHEWGHVIQDYLITKTAKERGLKLDFVNDRDKTFIEMKYIAQEMREDITREVEKSIGKKVTDKYLKKTLSEYGRIYKEDDGKTKIDALNNEMEFFAECYANSICGKPNEWGVAIDKYLQDKI